MLNYLVIAFIAFMVYWNGRQGLFSAMMHLGAVIGAGAIALAVWEPLTVGFLLDRMPTFAWGVGLLAPFAVALLVIRVLFDTFVPGNIQLPVAVNWAGGAAFGLFSSILTAGITIVGINFLQMPQGIMGYQPYSLNDKARVVEYPERQMTFAVDQVAAGFFTSLSDGMLYNGTPMSVYQPDLARRAAVFRLRIDQNANLAAAPQSVEITGAYSERTPARNVEDIVLRAAGEQVQLPGNRIVIIDTTWSRLAGTFDIDSTLRLYPAQIWLATTPEDGPRDATPQLHQAIGVGKGVPGIPSREFNPFDQPSSMVFADSRGADLGFVFVVPESQRPRFLFARGLRLAVPDRIEEESARMKDLAGSAAAILSTTASTSKTPPKPKPSATQAARETKQLLKSAALPTLMSRNYTTTFRLQDGAIFSGKGEIRRSEGFIPPEVRVNQIYVPEHQVGLRIRLDKSDAGELFATATANPAVKSGVWVEDDAGTRYQPIGWVWRKGDGTLHTEIDRDNQITSVTQLPIGRMTDAEAVYVYFAVPRGVRIASFHLGDTVRAERLDTRE